MANTQNHRPKVHRFREYGLWLMDKYSSPPAKKYIYFENRLEYNPTGASEKELLALGNALLVSHILNRVLILPQAHPHRASYA